MGKPKRIKPIQRTVFASNLINTRLGLGLTRAAFVVELEHFKCFIGEKGYAAYEESRNEPSLATLRAISLAMKVSIDDLLTPMENSK